MKNSFFQEILVSGTLIVLIVLFLNPFMFWMPSAVHMMMVAGLVVIFSLFASFVWREGHRDEREAFHKLVAGRIAFLTGTALLTIGIIVESLRQNVDPWLVFVLSGMIAAKVFTLIYGRFKY